MPVPADAPVCSVFLTKLLPVGLPNRIGVYLSQGQRDRHQSGA
ncbi:MAG TPA: hypothetical protein VKA08_09185 [Balneolales bacterium]|nr:hypothetical protein [Balneolales bacterium]